MDDEGTLGVCLSGGGLRAASFGLGCLQELDAQQEVLRGEHAARYLAAVSGGSYTAAAVSIVLAAEDDGLAVVASGRRFAAGSDEARVLARDCDYFRQGWGRLILKVVLLLAFGAVSLVSIVLFLPTVVSIAAGWLEAPDEGWARAVGWIGLALWAVVTAWTVLSEPRSNDRHALLRSAPWSLALWATAPFVAALVVRTEFLGSASWWLARWDWVLAGVGLFVIFAVIWQRARRRRLAPTTIRGLLGGAIIAAAYRFLQVLAVLVPLWYMAGLLGGETALLPVTLVVVAGLALFNSTLDAASLHRFYSSRVASCFAVSQAWNPSLTVDEMLEVPMSKLRRRVPGERNRPELLVCAAANVKVSTTPVASFVMSPDEVRLYGADGTASLDTADYERVVYPSGRVLTIFRAVGLSGAAVSPSMGFMTIRAMRGLLALGNVRLGRWMPNPADPSVRADCDEPGERHWHPGVREGLRELWGYHPAKAPLIYVTDGGHYENLGLVELLRRECALAVAIDSSGGPPGSTGSLEHTINLAVSELDLEIELDTSPFRRSRESPAGINRCWSLGLVHYRNGTTGTLLVIRLGIDPDTPKDVVRQGRAIHRFPHTSTLNQFFDAHMFDAYAALGRSSVATALRSPDVMKAFSDWRSMSDREAEPSPVLRGPQSRPQTR